MICDDKFKDYFDSLINDFGEEEDEIYDSPQLDAKTGEFKTKEKEDNDIEILEEVVNVQRPKKELQLVKLVKIAPKPEVSVKKVKLDPSTGLFHDESGQEIQISSLLGRKRTFSLSVRHFHVEIKNYLNSWNFRISVEKILV